MQPNSSTTSSSVDGTSARSARYAVVLVAAVVLPNLIAALLFLARPEIFYFRAWEYMSDVVYRVEGAGREWRGPEKGDESRTSILRAQEAWVTKVSVDELGFRSVPIHADRYPIAAAGDSLVFGSALSDDETVAWMLAERLGQPVFNGGRSDFDNLLKHPQLAEVALVLDFRGEEGLLDHFTELDLKTEFVPLRNPVGSLIRSVPPERYLPAPIAMRFASRLAYDLINLGRSTGTDPDWRFGRVKHDPLHFDDVVDGALRRSDALRAMGIEYALVPIPKKQNIYGRDHGLEVDEFTWTFTARLVEALRARGVHAVDLATPMREHRDEELLYFRTDTHWTGAGVRVSVDAIVSQLDFDALLRRDAPRAPTRRLRSVPDEAGSTPADPCCIVAGAGRSALASRGVDAEEALWR